MKILVINAGSSSLKYQLISMTNQVLLAKGLVERIGIDGSNLKHQPQGKDSVIIEKPMKNHAEAIHLVIEALIDKNHGVISSMDEIKAVGHRVVHGGEYFNKSVIINDEVKKAIEICADLAPLHNRPNLIGIQACEEAMPNVPQVAVFDTSFHQSMPKEAFLYAIPYELYEQKKIRRYGFHGTSHKYVAQRAAKMLGKSIDELNLITIHLGNGSSITAIKNGKSVDTSMGFTPLAGVMMGTRCGDIDPAIVFYLMENENMTGSQVSDILNKKSGVLSISGVSSDFRDIEAAEAEGNERASLALKMFAYQVKKYIGSYVAALGHVDAIVFTAGIGENNNKMRAAIVDGLECMGMKLDLEKNNQRGIEADVSTADSATKILVIPTNEELMIAQETQALV